MARSVIKAEQAQRCVCCQDKFMVGGRTQRYIFFKKDCCLHLCLLYYNQKFFNLINFLKSQKQSTEYVRSEFEDFRNNSTQLPKCKHCCFSLP